MPLQATSGAASYDGFGGGVAAVPQYIEDVFSTWLYTGNDSTQNIVNGIDLSTKGGLVWLKGRSLATGNYLYDTVRGIANGPLSSQNTNEAYTANTPKTLTTFNSDGFSMQDDSATFGTNVSPRTYVSWTLRKQPKFFDIQTWTGDGTNRAIPHNLGSVPGCMIVKCTNAAYGWMVYHRSTGATKFLYLDTTEAAITNSTAWNDTEPTSTVFTVGNAPLGNESGKTYVAYLFAHDAGGFGLSGTDNVISCGSYTGTGTTPGPVVTLGYEPQWVIWKRADAGTEEWHIRDVMRGMPVTASGKDLYANSSSAEGSTTNEGLIPTATGLQVIGTNTNANASGGTYIYIAIRRGPMKVPTLGTSVFLPQTRTGTGAAATVSNVGFSSDLIIGRNRPVTYGVAWAWTDKLRGTTRWLDSENTGSEQPTTNSVTAFGNTGASYGDDTTTTCFNYGSVEQFYFQRAPSFFDEVCYTGTGSATTFAHNLGVVPELIIVKSRSDASGWRVYSAALGAGYLLQLNSTAAAFDDSPSYATWNNTTPTSSVFSVGAASAVNGSGATYVAYLFATCAGVSKVGSYTGTATTKQIDCGFTGGARFVLIKRTDDVGDWYVWDTARGIVSGNDPYLLLNSTAAEVTGTDYVDTAATGFEISSTAPAAINASGGTFIFLAIA